VTEERAAYKIDPKLAEKLSAPFPPQAYEADDSRGFQLVGIKGAYVIERLNQVLGLCGIGWAYTVNEIEHEKHVTVEVQLRWRVNGEWSEPIHQVGSSNIVGGRYGDALKGAITDGVKKCASMLGVGIEAYKGELAPDSPSTTKASKAAKADPDAAFTYDGFKPDTQVFERAGAVVFPSGKHEAEPISAVDQTDRGYIAWLSEQDAKEKDNPWYPVWAAARYFRAYRKWQEAQQRQEA